MRFRDIALGVVLSFAVVTGANAHHSFAALYDVAKTISLSGEVTKLEFKSPHAYIHFKVTGSGGKSEAWQIETTTPGMLIRAGLTPETLRVGDKVSVTGNPTRDGRKIIRLLTITMPNGKKLELQ